MNHNSTRPAGVGDSLRSGELWTTVNITSNREFLLLREIMHVFHAGTHNVVISDTVASPYVYWEIS